METISGHRTRAGSPRPPRLPSPCSVRCFCSLASRAWARGVFSTIGTDGLILMAAPLAGYLIGAVYLGSVAFFIPIALHTALGLVVLILGALALRPDTGWMALLSRDSEVPLRPSWCCPLPWPPRCCSLRWSIRGGTPGSTGRSSRSGSARWSPRRCWEPPCYGMPRAWMPASHPTGRGGGPPRPIPVPGRDQPRLRQPVQALMLFTSALAAKITGAPASALLDDIRGSVEALDLLLDALLDVSSLNSATSFRMKPSSRSPPSSNGWLLNSSLRPARRKSGSGWCRARRSSGPTRRCSTGFSRISYPMRCATPARAGISDRLPAVRPEAAYRSGRFRHRHSRGPAAGGFHRGVPDRQSWSATAGALVWLGHRRACRGCCAAR